MKAISDARTCKDGCKYVRERLQVLVWRMQCTASFSRKRLHPLPQTFATFASNVCGEKTPFCGISSPMFSDKPQI